MWNYKTLTPELTERIVEERQTGTFKSFAFDEKNVLRRNNQKDVATVWRPAFVRDADKILHCPYYNRYADKTQVFSFYKNDDICHRSLHVQLVSRIARTIGATLNLNLDLIEAIALGHDIGHTPFGHAGETYLDELLSGHTGRHFSHNIHSVRVLDSIFPYNISLQTLSGIAGHNGEMELAEYYPQPLNDFLEFDSQVEACYLDKENNKRLVPSTLEGCVVRIADIIAYLGKDRQDAERALSITHKDFAGGAIGTINAEIINNLIVNIIENSYGKPYIKLDPTHFQALQEAKDENYKTIYKIPTVRKKADEIIRPMMRQIYERLLNDLKQGNRSSPVFTHHIDYVNQVHYTRVTPYEATEPNQIVTDFIASMTDDYFIDLHTHIFPDSKYRIQYKGYFD